MESTENLRRAQLFGTSLDQDDFATTLPLLHPDCSYDTGSNQFSGAEAIVNMYRDNMLEGRKKWDFLEWGTSEVKTSQDGNETVYRVCFTDRLGHAGKFHTYSCEQHLRFGADHLVCDIRHVEIPGQKEGLLAFKKAVGLS